MSDKIVGYKTFYDKDKGYSHTPICESEAKVMMERINAINAAKAKREADMPDEQAAIRAMFEAWVRLKELGWREAISCPKDGTLFSVIEPGSTRIHDDCSYWGEWPKNGGWQVHADFDSRPSYPILWKKKA
jgi:hypothetical protein